MMGKHEVISLERNHADVRHRIAPTAKFPGEHLALAWLAGV
jgi:hypothetical protein